MVRAPRPCKIKLLSLLLLLLLAGCPGKHLYRSWRQSELLNPTQANEDIKHFQDSWESIDTYKALARVKLDSPRGGQDFRQAFLFAKPDRFRLEFLPVNGVYTLGLFVAKSKIALYLDPGEKTFKQGPVTRHAVASVLRIPAELDDVKAYLLGLVPTRFLGSYRSYSKPSIYQGENAKECILVVGDGEYIAWYNCAKKVIQRFELHDAFNEKVILSGSYRDFIRISDQLVPSRVLVELPRDNSSVNFTFTSQNINQSIRDELFDVPVPSDFSSAGKFSEGID